MRNLLLLFSLITFTSFVNSYEDPTKYKDIDPKYISVEVNDPEQKVGYTVGDLIERKIKVSIFKPFILIEESLPIVGYEKRYRGDLLGMSLMNSGYKKKVTKEKSVYEIDLTYQIFTNKRFAKPAAITADYYRVMDPSKPDEIFKLRVPSFTFAVSPIAIFGAIKVENDMSDYRGPFLINTDKETKIQIGSTIIFILGLLVLSYIYSRYTWWPSKNKIFSQIYRKYRKTESSKENLEGFLKALHHGFDNTLGQTVFIDNVNLLHQQNESFKNIENEINDFFKLSRSVFFGKTSKINQANAYNWLKGFSLHCRLCERGLIVDKNDFKRFDTTK